VKTKGEKPTPRWGHSAVLVARDDDDDDATMWVFGGVTSTDVNNDLFCYHFRTCPALNHEHANAQPG
jgi:hypothetical protein